MSPGSAFGSESELGPRKNMLIKSLVLILVNDSISGNKNGSAALAMNAKKEQKKDDAAP